MTLRQKIGSIRSELEVVHEVEAAEADFGSNFRGDAHQSFGSVLAAQEVFAAEVHGDGAYLFVFVDGAGGLVQDVGGNVRGHDGEAQGGDPLGMVYVETIMREEHNHVAFAS